MTPTGSTRAAVDRALSTGIFQETKVYPATFNTVLSQLQTIPFIVQYLKGSQMSGGMIRHWGGLTPRKLWSSSFQIEEVHISHANLDVP